jgi:hypothetical protein
MLYIDGENKHIVDGILSSRELVFKLTSLFSRGGRSPYFRRCADTDTVSHCASARMCTEPSAVSSLRPFSFKFTSPPRARPCACQTIINLFKRNTSASRRARGWNCEQKVQLWKITGRATLSLRRRVPHPMSLITIPARHRPCSTDFQLVSL